MITREALMEELQKLRQSRERPFTTKSKPKQSKKDKLLEEAAALLDSVNEES